MKKLILTMIVMASVLVTVAQAQSVVAKREFNNTLKAYFETKNALAKDNAIAAVDGAKGLLENLSGFPVKTLTPAQQTLWNTQTEEIKKAATAIVAEKDIKEQRKQFGNVSYAMVKLAKDFNLNKDVVYVQYCPMAKKSWLNEVEAVQNPFYGSKMYDCGEVTETLSKK